MSFKFPSRLSRLSRPSRPSRLSTTVASVLATGLMLTIAGCSGLTPLGPDPAAGLPQPHRLRTPLVLHAMLVQPPALAGGCAAGYVAFAAGLGQCYRMTGTPVTITSAAVSPVALATQPPTMYQFVVTLSIAEAPELTAVTTTAYQAQGALGITVAGQTWAQGMVAGPFRGLQFQIFLPSESQALQLQRTLAAAG